MKDNKFVIISCGWNCGNYVRQHIESIQKQTYQNYTHIIVDDASTDDTYKNILKYSKGSKTKIYRNDNNIKWIESVIKYLPENISNNDIIVTVDLDDWLSKPNVLEILNNKYNVGNYWMVYSRMYYTKSKTTSHWIPIYTENDIKKKLFRNMTWCFTHLRSFRFFLWEQLNKDDLKDSNGQYFKYCYDQVIFCPMLEMSSNGHIGFINDTLYVYNDDNINQVEKIHRKEQEKVRDIIRHKEKYETIW